MNDRNESNATNDILLYSTARKRHKIQHDCVCTQQEINLIMASAQSNYNFLWPQEDSIAL